MGATAAYRLGSGYRPLRQVQEIQETFFEHRKSVAQYALTHMPFFKFVDVTGAAPAAKREADFIAGRQQRRGALLQSGITRRMRSFESAAAKPDPAKMNRIIDDLWDDVSDDLESVGMTRNHLAMRFSRMLQYRRNSERSGERGNRFERLTGEQKAWFLREWRRREQ